MNGDLILFCSCRFIQSNISISTLAFVRICGLGLLLHAIFLVFHKGQYFEMSGDQQESL